MPRYFATAISAIAASMWNPHNSPGVRSLNLAVRLLRMASWFRIAPMVIAAHASNLVRVIFTKKKATLTFPGQCAPSLLKLRSIAGQRYADQIRMASHPHLVVAFFSLEHHPSQIFGFLGTKRPSALRLDCPAVAAR